MSIEDLLGRLYGAMDDRGREFLDKLTGRDGDDSEPVGEEYRWHCIYCDRKYQGSVCQECRDQIKRGEL